MATVYILYSRSIDRYYVGSCKDLRQRLEAHKSKSYQSAYTSRSDDQELYYSLDNLEYKQARSIELRIKRMKSREYIVNLQRYSEISSKLREKYRAGSSR